MCLYVPQRLPITMLVQFPDDDAPSDYGEPGRQRTPAPKTAECRFVASQQFRKCFCTQILGVISRQLQAVCLSRLADHLQDQAGKSIDKGSPAAGIPSEQIVNQSAICVCQRHDKLLQKTTRTTMPNR